MRTTVRVSSVIALVVAAGGCVAPAEPSREARPGLWLQEGEPGGDPGAAEMEAWMKAATPGEPHAQLAKMAGEWSVHSAWAQAPGQEMESTGTARFETILGGRFVTQKADGTMMGMPFEGFGVAGYDNLKKQYVSVWLDSMGTMVMICHGTSTDGGKTITYKSEMQNPVDGKVIPLRLVETFVSDDVHTMEMYNPGKDGQEMRSMKLTYTRVKGEAKGGGEDGAKGDGEGK
jgi:hypothetical protein